jgi:hypothetical protein
MIWLQGFQHWIRERERDRERERERERGREREREREGEGGHGQETNSRNVEGGKWRPGTCVTLSLFT